MKKRKSRFKRPSLRKKGKTDPPAAPPPTGKHLVVKYRMMLTKKEGNISEAGAAQQGYIATFRLQQAAYPSHEQRKATL